MNSATIVRRNISIALSASLSRTILSSKNIACEEPGGPAKSKGSHILRVWQNHGLQLDRVPEGFELLATSYLCRNQMMVKRTDGQLIYTVQFHLEKSFEDWNKSRTRWEHPNESRDGRILFENFLTLATS